MKKKLLYLLTFATVSFISLSSFIETNEEAANTYDTVSCYKYDEETGDMEIETACNAPVEDGPCDRKKDCPEGFSTTFPF